MASTVPSDLPIVWRNGSDPSIYEEARVGRVFNNRRPNRYPIAVVEAANVDHVIAAVKLAKSHACRIAVRSGGHSWAAWSVRDESVLIDLGRYRSIEVSETSRIAKVSPSVTGSELNARLQADGLMFAGGHCPGVGLGGFLLQGGMGWNCRNWGWACEKVVAIDAVTADGELIHCSSKEAQNLLWAARGAGPGFPAVVTCFHLELRPLPKVMMATTMIFSKDDYRPVMDWVTKLVPETDNTEIVCVGATPPRETEQRVIVHIVAFTSTDDEARESLSVFRSPPVSPLDAIYETPTSLEKEYCDQRDANPAGHRYCVDNAYISNNENVTDVLESAFTTIPNAKSFSLWYAMYPCSRREIADMSLSMQSDHYFALYTIWEDQKDDPRMLSWVGDIMKSVERKSEGAYLGDSDFQVRRTRFWGQQQGKELMKLRREWDPDGMICGFLDVEDQSLQNGLCNEHEWK